MLDIENQEFIENQEIKEKLSLLTIISLTIFFLSLAGVALILAILFALYIEITPHAIANSFLYPFL